MQLSSCGFPARLRIPDQLLDVIGPTLQRSPHLVGIASTIVDASYARLVATDVIKNSLDNMR
jgi:hypothetical protein